MHKVKSWPEYFRRVKSGEKGYEYRLNDRNYQPWDVLCLEEFDGDYTGDLVFVLVLSVMEDGGSFPITEGWCIMSIRLLNDENGGLTFAPVVDGSIDRATCIQIVELVRVQRATRSEGKP